MEMRQKLVVGTFLSLSICMIAIACIKLLGYSLQHSYGFIWQWFWLQREACVAVTLPSVTMFRTVFVSERLKASRQKVVPWYSSTVARLRRRNMLPEEHSNLELFPTILSATLSGIRTFIRGSRLGAVSEELGDYSDCQPSHGTDRGVPVAP